MINVAEVKKSIRAGELDVVKKCFEDSESDFKDYYDKYELRSEFLYEAVKANNFAVARYLLSKRASPFQLVSSFDKKSESFIWKKSPLHLAAKLNNVPMLKLFLEESFENIYSPESEYHELHVRLRAEDSNGNTALHYASKSGSFAAAEYLLSLGANPEVKNNKGHSATYMAPKTWRSLNAIFEEKLKILVEGDHLRKLDTFSLTQGQINFILNFVCDEATFSDFRKEVVIEYFAQKVHDPSYSGKTYTPSNRWNNGHSLLEIALKMNNMQLFLDQLQKAKKIGSNCYRNRIQCLYLSVCRSRNLPALQILLDVEPIGNLRTGGELDSDILFDILETTSVDAPSLRMTREVLSRVNFSVGDLEKMDEIEKRIEKSISRIKGEKIYATLLYREGRERVTEQENILQHIKEFKKREYEKKIALGILGVCAAGMGVKWAKDRFYAESEKSKEKRRQEPSDFTGSSVTSNHPREYHTMNVLKALRLNKRANEKSASGLDNPSALPITFMHKPSSLRCSLQRRALPANAFRTTIRKLFHR